MKSGRRAIALCAIAAAVLAGCATAPRQPRIERGAKAPPVASAPQRGGGYYLDDGPGASPPPDIDKIPNAEPKFEPLARAANNPYIVFGKEYVPSRSLQPFKQRGFASWYGRRFHGGRTSNGEIYDMYAMTAAHPTLPIPSYARVTNLVNGRTVVVRVNDRGPFFPGRIIDLSYTAASKLGYVENGQALVEVEAIMPGDTVVARAAAPSPESVGRPIDASSPEPVPATDGVAVPIASDASGVYLQVASFSARENAEALRARLALELGWLTQPLAIVARDGLFRLRAGPFDDRAQALAAATRIRESLDVAPMIVGP